MLKLSIFLNIFVLNQLNIKNVLLLITNNTVQRDLDKQGINQ